MVLLSIDSIEEEVHLIVVDAPQTSWQSENKLWLIVIYNKYNSLPVITMRPAITVYSAYDPVSVCTDTQLYVE